MQLTLNSIERLQLLAMDRRAHHDLASFEQIEVEGVRGMSHLHRRVVGRVGDVIDAVMRLDQQTFRDITWRFLDVHIAYRTRGVTRAKSRIENLNGKRLRLNELRQLGNDRLQLEVVDRRALARDAVM